MADPKDVEQSEHQPEKRDLIAALAGTARVRIHARGTLTATAMSNAAVLFEDRDERTDWEEIERRLDGLSTTQLRTLSALAQPVIPKLEMLTGWKPTATLDETVRLIATAVLAERLLAQERSHTRTLQWIAVIASLVSGLAGLAFGHYLGKS